MASNDTQLITAALEEAVKVFEEVTTLTDKTQPYEPNPGTMQRSSDIYWKNLQQNANVIDGKDISGETPDGMLELSISGSMGDYSNIYRTIESQNLRDDRTFRNSMRAGAMALAGDMEYKGLQKAATHGSFCKAYSQAPGPGALQTKVWTALAESETRMFDSEICTTEGTTAFLNGGVYTAGGEFLTTSSANFKNSTPDDAYNRGMIQNQIAGVSEVYRHNKLYRMPAATTETITVNGAQSFKPEAVFDTLDPNGAQTTVDHRFATLPVTGTITGVNIGDKFTFAGNKAVALGTTKQVQDYDQTFTVVSKGAGTLTISPKPIALEDPALSELEKQYANIEDVILDSAAITFLNTTAQQSNIIMADNSLVLATQPITVNNDIFQGLFAEQFEAGPIKGMLGFETSLGKLTGNYRMAIWYDWQVERPEAIGTILFNQA